MTASFSSRNILETSALSRRELFRRLTAGAAVCGGLQLCSHNSWAELPKLVAMIDEAPEKHPLAPALKLAADSLKALEPIQDYTALMIKVEMLSNCLHTSKLEVKFREKPRSIYLKFQQPSAGRQALWVDGKYKNELQVRDVGLASLAGTLSLDPKGKMALRESRYPIMMMGMKMMLETLIEHWLAETKTDAANITANLFPDAKIGTQAVQLVEVTYAKPTPHTKSVLTRLYLDSQTKLPIRVQHHEPGKHKNDKPVLTEDYHYTNIKTNVGLKDIDFDTKNPQYGM